MMLASVDVGQVVALFLVLMVAVPLAAFLIRLVADFFLLGPLINFILVVLGPVFAPLFVLKRKLMPPGPVLVQNPWTWRDGFGTAVFYGSAVILVWLGALFLLPLWPVVTLALLPIAHLPALIFWFNDPAAMTKRIMAYSARLQRMLPHRELQREYETQFPKIRFWSQIVAHLLAGSAVLLLTRHVFEERIGQLTAPDSPQIAVRAARAAISTVSMPLKEIAATPLAYVAIVFLCLLAVRAAAYFAFSVLRGADTPQDTWVRTCGKDYFLGSVLAWCVALILLPALLVYWHKDGIDPPAIAKFFTELDPHRQALLALGIAWIYICAATLYWFGKVKPVYLHTAVLSMSAVVVIVPIWFGAPAYLVQLKLKGPIESAAPAADPRITEPPKLTAAGPPSKGVSQSAPSIGPPPPPREESRVAGLPELTRHERETLRSLIQVLPYAYDLLNERFPITQNRFQKLAPIWQKFSFDAKWMRAILVWDYPGAPIWRPSTDRLNEFDAALRQNAMTNEQLLQLLRSLQEIRELEAWYVRKDERMDSALEELQTFLNDGSFTKYAGRTTAAELERKTKDHALFKDETYQFIDALSLPRATELNALRPPQNSYQAVFSDWERQRYSDFLAEQQFEDPHLERRFNACKDRFAALRPFVVKESQEVGGVTRAQLPWTAGRAGESPQFVTWTDPPSLGPPLSAEQIGVFREGIRSGTLLKSDLKMLLVHFRDQYRGTKWLRAQLKQISDAVTSGEDYLQARFREFFPEGSFFSHYGTTHLDVMTFSAADMEFIEKQLAERFGNVP